jgi:hypothetical protein
MKKGLWQKIGTGWRSEFFSPKDFVQRAAMISIAFALAHIFGLREYTSVLNGTIGSIGTSWQTSAVLGVTYILLYLATILLVPTLLLAAVLVIAWRKLIPARSNG